MIDGVSTFVRFVAVELYICRGTELLNKKYESE
jgi:hypothetical protein